MTDNELLQTINTQIKQNGAEDRITSDEMRKVLTDIVNSKPNKTELDNLKIGMIYQEPVDTKSKLPTVYTQAQIGYAVLVKDEGIIYQWNGTKWNPTGLTSFPSDVATKGGYSGTLKDLEIGKLNKNEAAFRYVPKVTNHKVNTWSGIANIEYDVDTQVFGSYQKATRITPLTATGNVSGYMININLSMANELDYKIGDSVTISFQLYSAVTVMGCIARSYGRSIEGSTGSMLNQTFDIKQGVNTYTFTLIADKIYTDFIQLLISINNQIGTPFYLINQIAYLGNPVIAPLVDNSAQKVDKIEGKGLSTNDFTTPEKEKLANLEYIHTSKLYENITNNNMGNYIPSNCTKEINGDGSLRFYKILPNDSTFNSYIFLNHLLPVSFKKSHDYYVVFDIRVDRADVFSGNFTPSIAPKYTEPILVGSGSIKKSVLIGERSTLKSLVSVDGSGNIDTYPTANRVFMQFGGKYSAGQGVDLSIYNIMVVDLGERGSESYLNYDAIDILFDKYGFEKTPIMVDNAKNAQKADYALVAKSVETLAVGGSIQFWGDSLTAQNYAAYIQQRTGRTCITRGYGGKTSTYIRDQFLNGVDKTMIQVLWLGRNNYAETDVIIDDYRRMVDYLGHDKFIICNPSNGNYGNLASMPGGVTGEMKGGGNYEYFSRLTELLQYEYGSNFLDLRRAQINGYNMGGVMLLKSFTQPEIGSTVQINVSDATFLTTYNSNDLSKFGTSVMNYIRIGFIDKSDKYEVISKDSNTLLTVKLVEANRISAGGTVANLIDNGGTNAVKYLRVMQNADYECYINDTLASTFRSDSVHMTEVGKKATALAIAKKLEAMKI